MGTRNLKWLRRNTNVEDLLDDGVENRSHLPRISSVTDSTVPDSNSSTIRRRTIDANRREYEQHLEMTYRRAFSLFGLALGVLIALAGVALLAFPIDMLVLHTRIRYLPSVVEHVTPGTSRLYGSALLFGGLGLAWFSLYRPRRL